MQVTFNLLSLTGFSGVFILKVVNFVLVCLVLYLHCEMISFSEYPCCRENDSNIDDMSNSSALSHTHPPLNGVFFL